MMGLSEIKSINRQGAKRAAEARKAPAVPTEAMRAKMREGHWATSGIRVPFFGDYRPPGWKLAYDLFVDTSGFGREGEAALTMAQLARHVAGLPPGYGVAVIEVGQFQGYLGVFRPLRVNAEGGEGE